ncbi:unnamed protein product [Acanthoscelides obtectus]|uniref:Uncharacterized protein n=1 Tax=Acanthoscelides obtectus TaxID=200917 RepID=A0A9P0KA02_ACAOB|nr:unnamed protein product [Acanthoscelides obtectus]CAK1632317.1 hypothetical protein AOBTE_LOCUS7477 [Acanthoscelides obtectus]
MEELEENVTNQTVCKAACGIRRMLNDYVFVFWPAQVKTAIDNFEKCIVDVRNKIDHIINKAKNICTEPPGNKRRRRNNSSHDHRVAALEIIW